MNDRAHAIAILRQAREILARRLTERILDLEEELLDDARGLTYLGDIETLYEQIAVRLSHVSAMLSQLPAEEESLAGGAYDSPSTCGEGADGVGVWPAIDSLGESCSPLEGAPLATETLTAPQEFTALPTVVTFEVFARQVLCGDVEMAGRSLAVLLAVDETLGQRCARTFHARLENASETMTRLVQLRRELQEGGINGPLRLLSECFGLDGLEAISVLQTLRARLIGHNEAA